LPSLDRAQKAAPEITPGATGVIAIVVVVLRVHMNMVVIVIAIVIVIVVVDDLDSTGHEAQPFSPLGNLHDRFAQRIALTRHVHPRRKRLDCAGTFVA
jgi:hypothetical protein